MARRANPDQGTLFEENYLQRTGGDQIRNPIVALTEFVANAWDAGATKVWVDIPQAVGGKLQVRDNGGGMTETEFRNRWMCLGYNRLNHQGPWADGHEKTRSRYAYGRNGQGRHGLLCFNNKEYLVETVSGGIYNKFRVYCTSGNAPFATELQVSRAARQRERGTTLTVVVDHHYLPVESVRDDLPSRFAADPNFQILINSVAAPAEEMKNFRHREERVLKLPSGRLVKLEVVVLENTPGRYKNQTGVAFWVGGRIVGQPQWSFGPYSLGDGRSRMGRRTLLIFRTEDLREDVKPDWTGFIPSDDILDLQRQVFDAGTQILLTLARDRVEEMTVESLTPHRDQLEELDPGDRRAVLGLVESVAANDPQIAETTMNTMIDAAIKMGSTQQRLIRKITELSHQDQETLDRLLDEWSVEDAAKVLDEVGRRLRVVELIEKLMSDKEADELATLHPLVLNARWLFGPEYDSMEYASNVTMRTAMKQVFGQQVSQEAFENPRRRMDILVLPESSVCGFATEQPDPHNPNLSIPGRALIIELKKGGKTLGRTEVNQASGYVQDMRLCGHFSTDVKIVAHVVGHHISSKTAHRHTIEERDEVHVTTFATLVDTGRRRLFRLQEVVKERYQERGSELLARIMTPKSQIELFGEEMKMKPTRKKKASPQSKTADAVDSSAPG